MDEDFEIDYGDNPVGNELARLGPEFAVAYNVPRLWVSGAQVFVSQNTTMMIMREQTTLKNDQGQEKVLLKNVASFVMETSTAADICRVLASQLGFQLTEEKPD